MRFGVAAVLALAITACAASRPIPKLTCANPKTRIWPVPHGAAIQPAKESVIRVSQRILDAAPENGINGTAEPRFDVTFHDKSMGDLSGTMELPGRIQRHPEGDATVIFDVSKVFLYPGSEPPFWSTQTFGIDKANHHLGAGWIQVEPDGSVHPGNAEPQDLDVDNVIEWVGSTGWKQDERIHYDDVFGFDVVVRTECASAGTP